jgi:hypothetical protein
LNCDNNVGLERKASIKPKKSQHRPKRTGELKIDRRLNLDTSLVHIEKTTYGGLTLSPSLKFKKAYELNLQKKKATYTTSLKMQHQTTANNLKSNSTYYLLKDYSNLGWSMASGDINEDDADDLIMGAPVYSPLNFYQSGAVFVVLSKNGAPLPLNNLNLQQSADLIIEAPMGAARSRFGHSITILDINLDGANDIIVSAPSYMLNKMSYEVI